MNNFRLIEKNIATDVFLAELNTFLDKNSWETDRSMLHEQQHTQSIHLRSGILTTEFPDIKGTPFHKLNGKAYPYFQNTYAFLERFAALQKGELCRTLIVALQPFSQVYRHYDKGLYYMPRDRYHLVLKSNGSIMTCGEEISVWQQGELWWFNNKIPHEAFNNSDTFRIHIIFDILPTRATLLKRIENLLIKKYFLLNHSN